MNRITKASLLLGGCLLLVSPAACGQKGSSATLKSLDAQLAPKTLQSTDDSLYYAVGYNIEKDMHRFFSEHKLDIEKNADLFLKGFVDAMNNKTQTFDETTCRTYVNNQIQKMRATMANEALDKGKQFLEANKKAQGVKELPNGEGIQYIVLNNGKGTTKPALEDTVECHYVGTLTDGKEFDNSVKRGQPARFPLNGVIRGWQIVVGQMKEGDKWKVFIPSELGYGASGAGGSIPPNAVLVFEIELIKIIKKK